MKKLLLLTACGLGLLAAGPVRAQYYQVPYLPAGQNPGAVNTDGEGRYDLGQPGWSLLLTGDAASQAAPVWSAVQTLPFAFQLGGPSFTAYAVSSSGVLTFLPGPTPATAGLPVPPTSNVGLPSALVPNNSVCAWGTLLTASNDYVISKTFGTAPHRQHWVQFNSVTVPLGTTNNPSGTNYIYLSLVLEEGTNKVYFVWQRSGPGAQTLTAGVQLTSTAAVQVPSSPFVSVPDLADATPADNAYYEFAPGTQPAYDLALNKLYVVRSAVRNTDIAVKGRFRNVGTQATNSVTLNYRAGTGPVVSNVVTGLAVSLLDTAQVAATVPWRPTQGGVIPLKVWVSGPNGQPDANTGNDTLRTSVVVADSSMQRTVVEEDFTSSTCPPCLAGNANTRAINTLPANRDKLIEIKYQQNFPAPGNDPYYTAESGARFNYYSGSYVPYMLLDGGWGDNSQSYTAALLNEYHGRPALVRVRGTVARAGSTVSVTAQVKPLLPVPAGRLVAHIVITERETRNNARTNGETRFFDVMKKMLPNANGTLLPALASGEVYSLAQSFDMSTLPTSQAVEHLDSLRAVVFVQDVVTKQIYQGARFNLPRVLAVRGSRGGPQFALAPNPAGAGRSTLYVTLDQPQTVRVEVLDNLGRRVWERPALRLGNGPQHVDVELPRQAAGLYTVRLTTARGVSTAKLVVD